MSYFGKEFVLESQENFDGFLNAIGSKLPDDVKKAIAGHKATAKLVKNGDKYTLISGHATGPREVTFSLGVEYEESAFGNTAKVTTTQEGDTFVSVHKYDQGTITFKRQFSDNQLIVTITTNTWDGVAKRIYKA